MIQVFLLILFLLSSESGMSNIEYNTHSIDGDDVISIESLFNNFLFKLFISQSPRLFLSKIIILLQHFFIFCISLILGVLFAFFNNPYK